MSRKGFNRNEFSKIAQKLNNNAYIKDVDFVCSRKSFFERMQKNIQTDRRGETVFAVVRPDGEIITVTCSEYPEGIFRIPTGGLNYDENITEGVHREVLEELGLKSEISDFAGVLKIKIIFEEDFIMFYSYVFIMREISGELLKDATDQEVSEVKLVGLTELSAVADKLMNIEGVWHDWGRFRYITTRAVYEYLSGNV